MNVILLGAPGAGKGTQAALIKARYGIAHISTGDAFRKNIADATPVGMLAKTYIDAGKLVPDEVVVDIVAARIAQPDCRAGFLLDGFPRTLPQAEALDKLARVDAVLEIAISEQEVLRRLGGRLSCKCGATYHKSTYASDVCKVCGQPLFVRDDDKEQTILERLNVYRRQTEPLVAYYRKQGKLHTVDGAGDEQTVFAGIVKVLG